MSLITPSLQLAYANTKRLDPRITFTNSSANRSYFDAAGVMRYAGVNEPLFDHDPLTGESLGWGIWAARTNLLTYSQQMGNAAWTKSNANIIAVDNIWIAPDGTLTASAVDVSVPATDSRIYQSATVANDSVGSSASVFIKRGSNELETRIDLRFTGGAATLNYAYYFTWSTGVLAAVSGNNVAINTSVVALPNGWYRFSVSGFNNSTGNTTAALSVPQLFTACRIPP